MEEKKLIRLEQAPIINTKGLSGIGELVDKRIKSLDIDSLVATADTVKSLKEIKASLNKELKVYEDDRKMLKNAINEPYKVFDLAYKANISTKYNDAVDKLTEKILYVEDDLRKQKREKIESFFNETCKQSDIDFIKFEKAIPKVNLSDTDAHLKKKVTAFIEGVQRDIETIKILSYDDDYKADVLVEYEKSLDLNSALDMIQNRYEAKKKIMPEKAVKKAEEEKEISHVDTPLSAPVVENLMSMSFKVTADVYKLKALKQYLIENNIEFKSI